MPWARRAEGPWPHTCPVPTRYVVLRTVPNGQPGDVWWCPDCRLLWTIKRHPPKRFRRGYSAVASVWRPAGWWLRLRYRNRGRTHTLRPPVAPIGPFRDAGHVLA
jgi:hypothetical protein